MLKFHYYGRHLVVMKGYSKGNIGNNNKAALVDIKGNILFGFITVQMVYYMRPDRHDFADKTFFIRNSLF